MSGREPIIQDNGTALFPLTQGLFATVDITDVGLLIGENWCAAKSKRWPTYYAVTSEGLRMHRVIMGNPIGLIVNHRDRDGLNNRRLNLRVREPRLMNVLRINTPNLLPRGVKATPSGRFVARLKARGEYRHLGTFDTPEEASAAYWAVARELYGEWALCQSAQTSD
jgi:hypothetical protein